MSNIKFIAFYPSLIPPLVIKILRK